MSLALKDKNIAAPQFGEMVGDARPDDAASYNDYVSRVHRNNRAQYRGFSELASKSFEFCARFAEFAFKNRALQRGLGFGVISAPRASRKGQTCFLAPNVPQCNSLQQGI
jgi:hypothetical protein